MPFPFKDRLHQAKVIVNLIGQFGEFRNVQRAKG